MTHKELLRQFRLAVMHRAHEEGRITDAQIARKIRELTYGVKDCGYARVRKTK